MQGKVQVLQLYILNEEQDALETKRLVEAEKQKCFLIRGDLQEQKFCKTTVNKCIRHFGGINILINNAAKQFP